MFVSSTEMKSTTESNVLGFVTVLPAYMKLLLINICCLRGALNLPILTSLYTCACLVINVIQVFI